MKLFPCSIQYWQLGLTLHWSQWKGVFLSRFDKIAITTWVKGVWTTHYSKFDNMLCRCIYGNLCQCRFMCAERIVIVVFCSPGNTIAISECIQCMQDKCLCKPRPLRKAVEKLDIPDQLFQQTSESWANPCAYCTGAEFSRLKFPKKNSFLNEQCDCRRNPKLIMRAFLETIRPIKTFGTTKTIMIIKNMRKVNTDANIYAVKPFEEKNG